MTKDTAAAETAPSVGIIVLAAGASTRLGSPKQLLSFQGRNLLVHACTTALALLGQPVVVVVGAQAQRMRAEIESLPVQIVENTAWQEGMGSSIRAGVRALQQSQTMVGGISGVVITLCDQPLVSPQIINALVQAHNSSGKAIVASQYADTMGVPAFFSAALFDELAALTGAEGAKALFKRHATNLVAVPFDGGSVDIDTPQDYADLQNLVGH